MRSLALIIFALLTLSGACFAQVPESAVRDTIRGPADSTFHMTKSPLEAILLSAAVPGAGQVYLHQAWKVPVIYALAGGFLYGALIQNFRYHEMIDSINERDARGTAADSAYANVFTSPREFYRNDRDKWWIYLGLVYVANLLDAYVSANLYDFDVSTPGGGGSPFESYYDPFGGQFGISYTLHF